VRAIVVSNEADICFWHNWKKKNFQAPLQLSTQKNENKEFEQ
jgi:hypothetical protein